MRSSLLTLLVVATTVTIACCYTPQAGNTALYNMGQAGFAGAVKSIAAFEPGAVNYAALYCYNIRAAATNATALKAQFDANSAFCKPFYDSLKTAAPSVMHTPWVGMGGDYANDNFACGDPCAQNIASVLIDQATQFGFGGFGIDMEISAHTPLGLAQKAVNFLDIVGAALHAKGLRLSILEKSTFINGVYTKQIVQNATDLDAVLLWFYNGESIVEKYMEDCHYAFKEKCGVMFEPNSEWDHDPKVASDLECLALKLGMAEVSYWTNLPMNATAWGAAMKAYASKDTKFCNLATSSD
eukprot:TRINITY_DN2207_c0_g2_i5.p1 TRINITY_DN2207_c0_g2~~TRINITY_DN2207_c0_g2_i5.p1  ORF type:complete len:298 (+),score=96.91 TRINITY_DN2207_c0_g2_i5:95-988(+)